MPKIKVNCKTCNNELDRYPYQIKASKTGFFFCGRDCKSLWHRKRSEEERVEFKCLSCGKKMMVTKYEKQRRTYCSLDCLGKEKTINGTEELECDFCGNNFIKRKSKITDMNFCTKKCSNNWESESSKRKRLHKDCLICGKTFYFIRSRENPTNCSIECNNIYKSRISTGDGYLADTIRKNALIGLKNRKLENTKPEKIVREELEKRKIEYIEQHEMYDRFLVDFYLPEDDIVLEVYGDYWHSNPSIYGYGDCFKTPNSHQEKQIKKDRARKGYIEKCGHKFIVFWEKDIYSNVDYLFDKYI